MAYYIIKVLISAILIVAISEISKRSSLVGSIFASIPLLSLMAFVWMYIDTKDVHKIADLSSGIFWLVIPSLSFFILFPVLLRKGMNFYLSLTLSTLAMVLFYFGMIYILKRCGVNL